MTELETLQRAKMYIEKLANGINPIDGTTIPDEDVVNNVRLSRCFFYVADVLRQLIDNGGITSQKKPKKAPFALPIERRSAFDFSHTPIPISEISKRINMLIESEKIAALPYRAIRDWLMSVDLLEEVPAEDGKSVKRPTPQGEDLGILLETRTGLSGSYFVVIYTLAAQHFILDNLDAIVEFETSRKENQGQPWSREHDEYLTESFRKAVPIKEIAIALKRTNGAVRARLKKLNLLA